MPMLSWLVCVRLCQMTMLIEGILPRKLTSDVMTWEHRKFGMWDGLSDSVCLADSVVQVKIDDSLTPFQTLTIGHKNEQMIKRLII